MSELSFSVPHPDLHPGLLSQDMSHGLDARYLSQYEVGEDRILIRDEVWGDAVIGEEPGDAVFLDLVEHPVIRRLHSIAQLTLPPFMETMPGIYTTDESDGFTRWHHAFGSLVFVRKKGMEMGLDPKLLRRLELTAFLSDATQWAGSHLGDFMFQGFGGPEDAHDLSQKEVLVKAGLSDSLERHGYTIDDVLLDNLPEGCKWVETDSPDLCTDRVDYGARQISRHLDLTQDVHNALNPAAFFIDPETSDLIMRDKATALGFAKAFLLLPTEHWNEPTHRLQLHILQEMVKHLFIHEEPLMFDPLMGTEAYNPQDYMLSIDADVFASFGRALPFIWAMRDISEEIGKQKRNIYSKVRKEELSRFLIDNTVTELPDPLSATRGWHAGAHSLFPSGIEMIVTESPEEVPDFKSHPNAVDFVLPGMKRRWVDPKYLGDDGKIYRLSETDENYLKLMRHQEQLLRRTYVARVLVNSQFKQHIEEGLALNEQEWPAVMQRPHMPADVFKESFRFAADYGVAHRKARISWAR